MDDISSDAKNDTLVNLPGISDLSSCSSGLANGRQHEGGNEYVKGGVDLSDAIDGTDSLFKDYPGEEKEEKIDDCNRSKSLPSLRNILNDSSSSASQEIDDTEEHAKASPHCDSEKCPKVTERPGECSSGQLNDETNKSPDKDVSLTDETKDKQVESFEMSDILKISTSPPKEDGLNQSKRASLKRKASFTSVSTASASDMEFRKRNKRPATMLAKCASAKSLKQSTFVSSTRLGRNAGLQFTSAFLGAIFGGVGVFATLASLPENFFQ